MTRLYAISLLVSLLLVSGAPAAVTPTEVPSVVEVTWQTTRTVYAPGVTSAFSLDDEGVHVSTGPDLIQVTGVTRAREVVVLLWFGERRQSVLVRVIDPPDVAPSPPLRHNFAELAGHGFVSTSMQSTSGSDGGPSFFFTHSFAWDQPLGN